MSDQIYNQHLKNVEPQLAPPGAGLPWFQLLFLKYYVGPFVSVRTTRDESQRRFKKVSQNILKLINGLSDHQLNQKVLIPKQMGLEDSSRYWSVAMTLEHIVIVGRAMCSVIAQLDKGIVPQVVADTAKVKPLGLMSSRESVELFKKFINEEYGTMEQNFKNFEAETRFHHPWFGQIKARQWYWLITIHTGLHLNQIKKILELSR